MSQGSNITGAPNGAGTVGAQCASVATGTPVDSNDVNGPFTGIVNDLATLDAKKVNRAGDTMTGELIVDNGTGESINTSGEILANGDVVLVAGGRDYAISAITNTSPSVVTTTTPHDLEDGDLVTVSGVLSPAALGVNGQWVVRVTGYSSTTFELVDSITTGAFSTVAGVVLRNAQAMYGSPRSVTRALNRYWNDGGGADPTNTTAGQSWYVNIGGTFQNATLTAPTRAQVIGADIELPQGSTLTAAAWAFNPYNGSAGHANVPLTLPAVAVSKIDLRSGTVTQLANAPLPAPTTLGAYENFTILQCTLTGTPEIVDNERFRYVTTFQTETSTYALQGTRVYAASCQAIVPGFAQN